VSTENTTLRVVDIAAETWPDAEALVDGDTRLTFSELRDLVMQAGRAAMAAGLEKGDRAAIWAPNRWEWVVTALGIHVAGGAVVPMTTRYKGDEAAFVLRSSGARLLFTVEGFLGNDYPAMLEGHETVVERTIVFGAPSWDEFLRGTTDREPPVVTEHDLSDVIFTSGTTGRPKGVMSTHGQSVRVVQAWCGIVGLRAGDRYLLVSPFSHTSGYKTGFIGAMNVGAVTCPIAVADVPALLDLISRERITMLPGTPTVFQTILTHPDKDKYDLSSLRLSAVGAAPVPVELVERMKAELFDTVVTGYGLTETTGVSTMSRFDDPPEIIARTVGRAIPGVEVRVVDESGNDVPPGTGGEVFVRGYNVMKGYWDAPEQTAETLDRDGWLHTGDVGTMDEAGQLTITDRLKDMYIVGGFNAYPAEIEAALLRRSDLAMAAVIGIPDERLGEVGMAFVVPTAGASPTEEEIIAWSRREMANYKVPRRVAVVDALPLNAVGKVVKPELREMVAAERARDGGGDAPPDAALAGPASGASAGRGGE
jgi:acyl-CoA synthetase (AMP-forming)/AMP-acid ligase II